MTELNNKELFALLQTQDEKKEVLEQWGTHFEKINKFNNKSIAIMRNIYKMLEIVRGTAAQRMDKAIIEVFDRDRKSVV